MEAEHDRPFWGVMVSWTPGGLESEGVLAELIDRSAKDREITFTAPHEPFQFSVMPFDLKDAFQPGIHTGGGRRGTSNPF